MGLEEEQELKTCIGIFRPLSDWHRRSFTEEETVAVGYADEFNDWVYSGDENDLLVVRIRRPGASIDHPMCARVVEGFVRCFRPWIGQDSPDLAAWIKDGINHNLSPNLQGKEENGCARNHPGGVLQPEAGCEGTRSSHRSAQRPV